MTRHLGRQTAGRTPRRLHLDSGIGVIHGDQAGAELKREAYKLHAQVCSIMANPKRLQIIELLSEGEKSVEELTNITGLRKANVSQHLALLRHYNLVSTRKEGLRVYYKIANPKVIQACRLMREVTLEQLSAGKRAVQVSYAAEI